ncbi:MAG: 30S ribosomal protein S7, partial [bacterium]|nr:30S ribosomal protein S7 [bacterium]
LINKVMKNGKKRLAEKLVYSALDGLAIKTKKEPMEAFEVAIKNISPQLEVKSKRIGGATYQVPIEVRGDRKIHLAYTWLLEAARNKSGKSFEKILATQLIDAYNNTGDAVKKKNDTRQMAEANRAFAHFARF